MMKIFNIKYNLLKDGSPIVEEVKAKTKKITELKTRGYKPIIIGNSNKCIAYHLGTK